MYRGSRDFGKQSHHDLIVSVVAQRWANPGKYSIATNPGSEKVRWVGSAENKKYPDLIAWVRGFNGDQAKWIAEVETEESVTETEAYGQWKEYASLGLPFYLIVPLGYKALAGAYAARVGARIDRVYEFWFADKTIQLA